jgi:hypothetical protein
LLVAAILVPALAFVGYLAYWAYTVTDWTWFGLLLAAGIGLLAFAAAPELFSLSEGEEPQQRPGEWCLTMSAPRPSGTPGSNSHATTASATQKPVSPEANAPNR